MPLPANVSTGVVAGTILNPDGSAAVGTVLRFDPVPPRLVDLSANVVIPMAQTNVATDSTGAFSVTLIATDDPDLSPIGWTYTVTVISGIDKDTFSINVPSGSTQNYASLAQVPASTGFLLPIVVGGGSADDTAALQAGLTAASALTNASLFSRRPEVHLLPNVIYSATQILVPQNVILMMHGAEIRGISATEVVVLNGSRSGIKNGEVRGDPANLATVGVHVPSASVWTVMEDVLCNGFQGPGFFIEGDAPRVINCFAQNCVLDDAALVSPTGALHIEGTLANDFWVLNGEFTASNTAMSASGNAYGAVIRGDAGLCDGVVAEISDHGFYVDGVHNRFTGCRADLNRGHGWVFAGGDGDLSACSSLSNGRETTNTYDGYNITGGAYRFSACSANVLSTLTAVQHRYGFNDTSTVTNAGSTFDASCYSNQHATAAINVPDPGGKVVCTQGPFINTSGTGTTWDVQTYRWPHSCWNLAAGSARNLTTLTRGVPGQRVTFRGDGFTTLVHSASGADTMRLIGGASVLSATNTLYEFVRVGGGFWIQV